MNVHHGEGKGDHDDCRLEALLTPCPRLRREENSNKRRSSQMVNVQEFHQIIQNHPNFWEEVKEQIDKDLFNNVKQVIVKEGAENERSKKLRRMKENVILPIIQHLEVWESYPVPALLYYHLWLALATLLVTAFLFGVALVPLLIGVAAITSTTATADLITTNDNPTEQYVIMLVHYTAAVVAAVHVGVLVLAYAIRRLSRRFQRKHIIVEQVLQDVFTLNAKQDFGISAEEASSKMKIWSDSFLVSSLIMCMGIISFWYYVLHIQLPWSRLMEKDASKTCTA
jgi:hypothetical protein